jgi:hypothetical protein
MLQVSPDELACWTQESCNYLLNSHMFSTEIDIVMTVRMIPSAPRTLQALAACALYQLGFIHRAAYAVICHRTRQHRTYVATHAYKLLDADWQEGFAGMYRWGRTTTVCARCAQPRHLFTGLDQIVMAGSSRLAFCVRRLERCSRSLKCRSCFRFAG